MVPTKCTVGEKGCFQQQNPEASLSKEYLKANKRVKDGKRDNDKTESGSKAEEPGRQKGAMHIKRMPIAIQMDYSRRFLLGTSSTCRLTKLKS